MSNNYRVIITIHTNNGYRPEELGVCGADISTVIRDVQNFVCGLYSSTDIQQISIDSITKVPNLQGSRPISVIRARQIGTKAQEDSLRD